MTEHDEARELTIIAEILSTNTSEELEPLDELELTETLEADPDFISLCKAERKLGFSF